METAIDDKTADIFAAELVKSFALRPDPTDRIAQAHYLIKVGITGYTSEDLMKNEKIKNALLSAFRHKHKQGFIEETSSDEDLVRGELDVVFAIQRRFKQR